MRRGLDCRNTIENRLADRLQRIRRLRRIHARAGDSPPMDLHYVNVPAPAGLPMAHSFQHADLVVRRACIGTHDGASAISRVIRAVRTRWKRRHDGLGTVLARRLADIRIRRFRRAIRPVRGNSGGIPAHWHRHSIHADLDAHQLPDANHHAEHRMAAHVGGFIIGGVFAWLLVSGLHALRGKSLQQRTLMYGVIMLAVIIAIVVACNMSNPLRANPLLGMFF